MTVVLGGLAALLLVVLAPIVVIMSGDDDEEQSGVTASGCSPTGGNDVGIPEEYQQYVEDAAAEAELPVALVGGLLGTESGYDPNAVSPVGAGGIGQFMPGTWAEYGNGQDRFDPESSIAATGRYLKAIQEMIAPVATTDQERIEFTLAAYNAGPGAVLQYEGIPPYPETENYVPTIMNLAQVEFSEDCTEPGGSTIGDLGTGEWTHPLPGGRHTSGFGPRPCPIGTACNKYTSNHHGVDFSTGGGTQIIAPTDIEITATSTNRYQGEYVVARMTDDPGLVFQFHHCQTGSTTVNVGDTVAVGNGLCTEGNTGNSSGAHLHFQINTAEANDSEPTYDHAVDPEPILIERGIL